MSFSALMTPKVVQAAVALCALALVSTLVVTGSRAAFTDTTGNTGNTWDAGEVTLTDDKTSAMFQTTEMVPGTTVQKCIEVNYDGTDTGTPTVKLYSAGGTNTTLNPDLNVTVEVADDDCATFSTGVSAITATDDTIDSLIANHSDFSTGLGQWTPTSGEMQPYRLTVTLDSNTDDGQQGAQGSADFTWEVQTSE